MLLPSAFPCNALAAPGAKPLRPQLTSSIPYQTVHSAQKAATSLLASCRALQAILGSAPGPPASQSSPRQEPSQRQQQTPPPSALRHEWRPSPPKSFETARPAPPRGLNKRRRGAFEEDQKMPAPAEEKEDFERIYVTPKRHRRAPLLMPLGLSAEDFDALVDDGDSSADHDEQVSLPTPGPQAGDSTNSHEPWTLDELGNYWTAADDRLLVETVLEKLKLSKREWNDCARRLGKDKDTLGKRWKMLVVEGNVGLRRGGRLRRTNLDIESW